jgi:uncharacterized cupin superfamily protein
MDAAFLVVGDRTADDEITYPDIDLELKAGPDGAKAFCHKDGTPYPRVPRDRIPGHGLGFSAW